MYVRVKDMKLSFGKQLKSWYKIMATKTINTILGPNDLAPF